MDEKDFYTAEEAKDLLFGKVGTPGRDEYEEQVDELRMSASDQE